ncbi:MAG: hypothetical protein ACREQV_12875, partial [Candidatus Binatia bacterium]
MIERLERFSFQRFEPFDGAQDKLRAAVDGTIGTSGTLRSIWLISFYRCAMKQTDVVYRITAAGLPQSAKNKHSALPQGQSS